MRRSSFLLCAITIYCFAPIYDAAGNFVSDGNYIYQYDGFNRLVQVNEIGTAEFDENSGTTIGSINGGELGDLVFRYVYDGLGRIIRKYRIESDGITALRYEDYYYDGIRRVQDVIRKPLTNGTPPPPCEEMQPVRFDGTRDPRWIEAYIGPTITYALEPCDYGPDPNAPIYTGPMYESWTDCESVCGTNDVDEFILQIDRNGH